MTVERSHLANNSVRHITQPVNAFTLVGICDSASTFLISFHLQQFEIPMSAHPRASVLQTAVASQDVILTG